MSKVTFTDQVDITYTDEFKQTFIDEYLAGKLPRQRFEEHGSLERIGSNNQPIAERRLMKKMD